MKVIDFLTGLFNMFNLTAYTDLDGNIVVNTLDDFYREGETLETVLESPFDATFSEIFGAGVSEESFSIDISKYVNTETIDVNRNKLYSEIAFEFEEPSTFAVLNANEFTKFRKFGNERIDNTNDDPILQGILAFDGGKYEISPKFEKVQYERMTDQSSPTDFMDIGWGWMVDKDQKPVLPKPLLLYAEHVKLSSPSSIAFDDNGSYQFPTSYYRPSNSITDGVSNKQSLHFGSENNEYYTNLGNNESSLFNNHWRNYILSIYDEKSRIVSIKAHLPASLINSIKLNTVLVINNRKFRINKLNTNITTGLTDLELITYREIESYYGTTIDTDTITIDTDLITIDTI